MVTRSQIEAAIGAGSGILRLEPSWVPRSFMIPGRRLKLHPDDLYALGGHRGGINERWFSSTTNADNGPGTPADEGLSYVRLADGSRFLLRDAVDRAGDLLLGPDVMSREGGWNLLCKFFDNMGPIPHHLHQSEEQAQLLGRRGKPEAYYFPPQYNKTDNDFPYTFMGLEPGTTKAQVRRCLENWNRGDNGILYLSRAFRLEVGTGWQINPRILHAPGSLVTYEPQVNSDVFAMFQSEVEGRITPRALLTKDVPPEYHDDLDYIVELLDWDANVNPTFAQDNRVFPRPVKPFAETEDAGYREQWICYGTEWYSAKELTVLPKRSRDDPRRRSLRGDPHARSRRRRSGPRVDAVDDPVRRDDGGRDLRHGRGGARWRPHREPQHDRSARAAETFRSRQSGQRAPQKARRKT